MKYIEVKTLPINEDEVITLAMNANNLTAGLDYLESMALNLEGKNQQEIEQLSGLIAGMKELSAKNARILANINL
ncbi:hypothetical protein L2302_03930 [Lactobacillus gasseri]|jgi:hypothetical protein|uniref:Uncharacterized protein n=1 Tax=Lactobacillus gasseri TaxID=1596 RepID=A0ABY3BGF0_LACGS|nr:MULTISPECIES: hypothetical protein [Lactobacillus]KXA27041.1 hypothetical protein HMPREF3210_00577 [Lactobacillus gasseri]MCT7704062.1 hypothetical protein [Lactobacillus gasseri]MCZ3484142.1 hypothetical protein [Lactobacillus gasseri]MCZ3486008.1 hypothetical protein [Lactobacillus gasseri]MCZ3492848.1 hypothetical protein [Lactobacillus gasseri]